MQSLHTICPHVSSQKQPNGYQICYQGPKIKTILEHTWSNTVSCKQLVHSI